MMAQSLQDLLLSPGHSTKKTTERATHLVFPQAAQDSKKSMQICVQMGQQWSVLWAGGQTWATVSDSCLLHEPDALDIVRNVQGN